MTTDPVPRWFFVHMQKTAGTTLYRRLHGHFGRAAVYPVRDDQRAFTASLDVDLLRRRLDEWGDRIRVVTGHFPLCVTELLGVPFTTMTVLREPVERTLSALRDLRERQPKFRGWPLERIYDDPIVFRCMIENHMVKMLAMRSDEMTDGALTAVTFEHRHLESAREALEERIDAWGVQEDFEAFCDELCRRYGWDLGRPRVTNATTPMEADDAFRARIARDNELDVELYRHALGVRRGRSAAHIG